MKLLSTIQMARALDTTPADVRRRSDELGGTIVAGRLVFAVGAPADTPAVNERELRDLVKQLVTQEYATRSSDRPDEPLTGGQIRLVHARRSAAGISKDEFKAHLGDRYGADSLTDLAQTQLDDVLEWIERTPVAQ